MAWMLLECFGEMEFTSVWSDPSSSMAKTVKVDRLMSANIKALPLQGYGRRSCAKDFSPLVIEVGIVAAAALLPVATTPTLAQAPANSTTAAVASATTPWGEPDLQGIWTVELDTPLQRLAKYESQEVFTEAQRAELDRERATLLARDRGTERGTEADVTGAYNSVFLSVKRVGARTSLIVDPPDGRIPTLTPEAQKIFAAEREFRLALMQSTEKCRTRAAVCGGGKYDPTPSPRRAENPPRYNTAPMNCQDGPEDVTLGERCLAGGLPEFGTAFGGSFRRIVQTPGGISIFYDVGQGQGWQRNIVMDARPHLPANIRQWYGDSRGHWEGSTLVIDVTNFGPKTDFLGSRENLHLVERWTSGRANHARIRRDDRRPDGVDAAVDRQAGVRQTERSGE